jgi:hypothetical protein
MVNNYYHFLNKNTLNVYVPANPVTVTYVNCLNKCYWREAILKT